MNKGDKVMCIKKIGVFPDKDFLKNETYIISSIILDEVYIRKEIDVVNSGRWFLITDFYKHFITLAEWREQQIKSVIDE